MKPTTVYIGAVFHGAWWRKRTRRWSVRCTLSQSPLNLATRIPLAGGHVEKPERNEGERLTPPPCREMEVAGRTEWGPNPAGPGARSPSS